MSPRDLDTAEFPAPTLKYGGLGPQNSAWVPSLTFHPSPASTLLSHCVCLIFTVAQWVGQGRGAGGVLPWTAKIRHIVGLLLDSPNRAGCEV